LLEINPELLVVWIAPTHTWASLAVFRKGSAQDKRTSSAQEKFFTNIAACKS